ncbi:carboxypeptidase S1 [Lentithecium fluviatile CBS 122367]|uniref:Carboxypeptidase n=1 Tax=Lentithecium fluviatile CBS 122367 TaxID=1168545 RepID=A0A6G1JIW5_9PLEO|nr:carboxypeptidase S1 [Lentithecium fluviatile CBS 122367]
MQFQLSMVLLASISGLVSRAFAQFPPPVTYDTVLKSPINPNITISYKEPEPGTCATAFSTQKQYSGYVTLPPFTLEPYQQNYSINTFFWFFEARNSSDTAPLTIWLNGGPGSSSMIGLFREAGPCEVVQLPDGSYGTQPNIWGWDRSSNLLFIDQPTQVGFSYDEAVNVTVNIRHRDIVYGPQPLPLGVPAWAVLNGTYSTGNEDHTENSTVIAASAAWHFLQGFLSAFPRYNPGQHPNLTVTEPTGVHLFAESYGGQYGPTFADYFEDQNERRRSGEISANNTLEIKLATLGIINGLVDMLIQMPFTASFVFNNTYGLQAIDQTKYLNLLSDFKAPDGCQERVKRCRERMRVRDPEGQGEKFDDATSFVCAKASDACYKLLGAVIEQSGQNPYDIRVEPTSSFPNYAYLEYLNSADVQRSIGAKVNYTETSSVVYNAFGETGDVVRGTQLQKLAELLARGIRVALIYGDADIICNWVGGEAVALELARNSVYNATFPAAGYADIVANASYVGGQVRQYGNLSFSRIYDAGHTIPSYQPETSFVVFSRIIQGDDIGMGRNVDLSNFGTQGPAHSSHINKAPPQPDNTCWIRAIHDTCSYDEKMAINKGLGVVKNGMWFLQADAAPPERPKPRIGTPGAHAEKPKTTTVADLTGVYTATATPTLTSTSGASSLRPLFRFRLRSPDRDSKDEDDKDDEEKEEKRTDVPLIAGLAGGLGGLLLL